MKTLTTLCIFFLLSAGSLLANISPEVTNVVAVQRPHTALIDLTFDLADADGDNLHVTLWYSTDGGQSWDDQCLTVSGDVGPGISAASGLSATWDAGVDFPAYINAGFLIRVYADDGNGSAEVPSGFVLINPGFFTMGNMWEGHTPHQVILTTPFVMSSTEVTNAQFVAAVQWAYDQGLVTLSNGNVVDAIGTSGLTLLKMNLPETPITFGFGVFSTQVPNLPVAGVSWFGAATYCDWMSLQAGLPMAYDHTTWLCNNHAPYQAAGYRLPTEAEWEYACRAGTDTNFNMGDCLDSNTDANINGHYSYFDCTDGPYLGALTDVASYPPNAWGLFDMHGNQNEWCNDFGEEYGGGDLTDPVGPASGQYKVFRSGAYGNSPELATSAWRGYQYPNTPYSEYSFRPVRSHQ